MLSRRTLLLSTAMTLVAASLPCTLRAQTASKTFHALSLLGEPKYGPDFPHLDYVNPQAPKGGEVRLYGIGGFDSFNAFIVKGDPGPSSSVETLMTSPDDDPNAEYGLIAESIEVPDDRSWVAFNLRPDARWHDGQPITVDDVIFSFNILKEKGAPTYRFYYANVVSAETAGDHKVKFTFNTKKNRELPQIMGQLPVLAKHYWDGRNFEEPTLEPPLGSGPYKVASFDAGRSVTLKRVPDYWGTSLPINIGQNNWDTIRYDYYKDPNIAFEAFKAGQYDFRQENSAKNWAIGYDVPAFRDGRIIKDKIPNRMPTGMQGYVFNLRREQFKDRRVREALGYAFDFAWTNKTLFYGQYVQANSYFFNSELASSGLPTGEELAILEKYRGRIPDEVFAKGFTLPTTDGSGNNRANLRTALDILKSAGWEVKGGKLTNNETGKTLGFEILLSDASHERVAQPFVQSLKRIGVDATIRTVDPAQYQNRMNDYDFDVTVDVFGQSLSPGNEQRWFWGSAVADQPGGQNTIGIKDPVVDELIELVIAAPDRQSLITRTHALDRVLLWGFYLIPQQRSTEIWVAYWNKFGRPEKTPGYGVGFSSWWVDQNKAAALGQQRTN
jgi:microcin C transport system substrate-binding protein